MSPVPAASRLHRRFPQLAATLPRIELGRSPTPVRRLDGLAADCGRELWIKDDGRFGELWGGNKARKLEWVLADVLRRGRRTVVTFGALATNHGLATALYGREVGLRTVLLLVDQPVDDHVRAQLERLRASGATIHFTRGSLRTALTTPFVVLRHADRHARRPPALLPVGGSSPLGVLGYVEAALELAEQVSAGELPEPSHVVVAAGSGGTAAGLVLGLRLAGLRSRVVGVLVNDRTTVDARTIMRLARRSARLLRRRGAPLPALSLGATSLDVHARFLGEGYGHHTPEAGAALAAARDREGVELDPVYTAKAMAGVIGLARSGELPGEGPVLYWHTHDSGPRTGGP